MMHTCASAARLRGGGPILHHGMKAKVSAGPHHLESSSAIRSVRADRAETVAGTGYSLTRIILVKPDA
jgi:hypothetical protein